MRLILQLSNFFKPFVKFALVLRESNFQLFKTVVFFLQLLLATFQLVLKSFELVFAIDLHLVGLILSFRKLFLLGREAIIDFFQSFTHFPSLVLLYLNLFNLFECLFPLIIEVELQVFLL